MDLDSFVTKILISCYEFKGGFDICYALLILNRVA